MTLCVGLVEGGRCVIGADSRAFSDDETIWDLAEPKAWKIDGVLFADAGPLRPSQILRCSVEIPRLPSGSSPEEIRQWMTGPLLDEIYCHLDGEYSSQEARDSHAILVGVRGVFGIICPETWEVLFPRGPAAIGSPIAVAGARGYLLATGEPWAAGIVDLDAEARIQGALSAGALVCPYVAGGWTIVRE